MSGQCRDRTHNALAYVEMEDGSRAQRESWSHRWSGWRRRRATSRSHIGRLFLRGPCISGLIRGLAPEGLLRAKEMVGSLPSVHGLGDWGQGRGRKGLGLGAEEGWSPGGAWGPEEKPMLSGRVRDKIYTEAAAGSRGRRHGSWSVCVRGRGPGVVVSMAKGQIVICS